MMLIKLFNDFFVELHNVTMSDKHDSVSRKTVKVTNAPALSQTEQYHSSRRQPYNNDISSNR